VQKDIYRRKILCCLAISLILAVSLWLFCPFPAVAQNLGDYFQITYDPVSFSKSEVNGGEVFYAKITGRATCTKDLPVSVSEANITWRVVAEDKANATRFTLNAGYTITINPFPSREGDATEINLSVPLTFHARANSGDYNVIGELIEAKVKVGFIGIGVSEYFPKSQPMGSVKYTASELAYVPTPTTTPTATSTPISAPAERGIDWWVWLIVAIAVSTTVINILWYLRHRNILKGTGKG
jgi:hypothetical protein